MSYSLDDVDAALARTFAAPPPRASERDTMPAPPAVLRVGEAIPFVDVGMKLRSPGGGLYRVTELLTLAGTDRAWLRWDGGVTMLHCADLVRDSWTLAEDFSGEASR